MEYEYGTSSMPYKYMRKAIQDANPAGGWTTPIDVAFSTADSSGITFLVEEDGSVNTSRSGDVSLSSTRPVVNDMQISLNVNNTLVQAYNDANGTNYKPLDPSLVKAIRN